TSRAAAMPKLRPARGADGNCAGRGLVAVFRASQRADVAMSHPSEILARLETLNAIGVALSHERDLATLLERILEAARDFADADGGTLYLVEGDTLRFEVLRNTSLGFVMGCRHGDPIGFP